MSKEKLRIIQKQIAVLECVKDGLSAESFAEKIEFLHRCNRIIATPARFFRIDKPYLDKKRLKRAQKGKVATLHNSRNNEAIDQKVLDVFKKAN